MWRQKGSVSLAAAVAMLLAAIGGTAAVAEDEPEFTRVAQWKIDRADWKAYVAHVDKWQKPVMDALLADGTITEWGVVATSLHRDGDFTHAAWFSTRTRGDSEKVWRAYRAHIERVGGSAGAAEQAMAKLERGHEDQFLRDMHIRGATKLIDDGVLYEWTVTLLPDSGNRFDRFWEDEVAPVYERLRKDGTILSYGLYSEEITTGGGALRGSWVVLHDIAGMDAMDSAFAEHRKSWSKTRADNWWSGIKDMVEIDSYREYLWDVIYYARGD